MMQQKKTLLSSSASFPNGSFAHQIVFSLQESKKGFILFLQPSDGFASSRPLLQTGCLTYRCLQGGSPLRV
jgi:hypothetical protein